MKSLYVILGFLLLRCVTVLAQQTAPVISVDFRNASVDEVVADIESKTPYHFFYDNARFDSLRVHFSARNQTVEQILKGIFEGTNYHYAIADQQIFLTKGRSIYTELSAGFFPDAPGQPNNSNNTTNTTNRPPAYADVVPDKTSTEARVENKIYEIGIKTNNIQDGKATIAGYIKDAKSGEPVIGASIFEPDLKIGKNTDQFGYYSLTLPKGRHTLLIRGLGMRDARRQIILYSDGSMNIEMQEQINTLKEVKISAEKVANVRSAELGVTKLDITSIKQVPAVFGEPDVLRVVLTLPGVQTVGEASTGFNVRGGAADQNLILLNDMTIYNPSHFFGFFSAFDPDIVKDIELYKSSIPEKYGGRLSSVLDVTDREGNKKKFTGSAGIGLLTSRINVEGPIDSNRTSFIFGGRTTYANWLLKTLPQEYKNSRASFYDVNLGLSHEIDAKNNLYFTAYLSHDGFQLNSDTAYSYSNKNAALKWKHNFNNKLYGVFTIGYDHYDYSIESTQNPINAYDLAFNINQSNLKADFNYYHDRKHTIDFGFSSVYYKLHPGTNEPVGSQSLLVPDVVPTQQALESAIYLGDKYDITEKLTVNAGIRYSIYNFLGPYTVNYYAPNQPRETTTLVDSVHYGNNKVIKTYSSPEIRLSARYTLTDNSSIKGGYNTLTQYLHLLSNTTAISPTDVYQLSDPNIKPQHGDQASLGYYHNFSSNTIETSVEVYYKRLHNYLDYKSGATLVLNHHIETDVLETEGKAYGVEFLVRKTAGKLNGWMSYTYSRTLLRQDDPNAGELINGGAYYPANFDKPHAFNFTGNYRFTHRYSVSLNTVYSTGRPITLPIATYYYGGSERVFYSDRNQYRIPDYFRSDFSINIEGNHKVHQKTHNSWTIGVYNLTGRKNAYSTYFIEESGVINGYKLSIFADPIPFINYNIRF